jgi:hypothetical protein
MANNIYFIHINKCGGTSVKNLISKYQHIILPPNDDLIEISKTPIWEITKKVAIVRNPYHRVLSLYHMLLRDNVKISLDKVIDIITNEKIKYRVKDGGLRHGTLEYIRRHGLPATHKHYSIYDHNSNKLTLDYFFKLETLNDDKQKFKEVLEIKSELPHLNKSKNMNNKKSLTEHQIQRINKYFHLDFIKFNYNKL